MVRFLFILPAVVLVLVDASTQLRAQTDWRYEVLNLPPVSCHVSVLGGVYHATTNWNAFALDTANGLWTRVSDDVTSLRVWTVQVTGVASAERNGGTERYDPLTRTFSRRDSIVYDFEHTDSVVCAVRSVYDPAASLHLVVATWIAWPARTNLRSDTVVLDDPIVKVLACADTTALVLTSRHAIRYRYGRSPELIELPDTIRSSRSSVYIDRDRTHILVHGRNSLMFSAENGRSWRRLLTSEQPSVHSFCATSDSNVIFVVLDSALVRYHVSTGDRDTVFSSKRWGSVMVVAHGPKGAIVSLPDTVMLIDDITKTKQLVHAGLPERSADDLMALPDGIAGAAWFEIVHHPSHGVWSTPSIDKYWLNIDPYGGPMVFRGGRSLSDLWLTRGNWALHIKPSTFVNAKENLLLPTAGCWAHPVGYRFTVISTLDIEGGNRQVTWWSGSSPDRILLVKDGLSFLVSFEDSVLVAFSGQGSTWRTVDNSHQYWKEIGIPYFSLGHQPRSVAKGTFGVVRGQRAMASTSDAGRSWRVDSLVNDETVTITRNGVALYVREVRLDDLSTRLVIEQQVGPNRATVAMLPDSVYNGQGMRVTAAAFDDNEQRLYIATNKWVGSLSVNTVGVPETTTRTNFVVDPHLYGWYDLFGRYLGTEPPSGASVGFYIEVSEQGVIKRVR